MGIQSDEATYYMMGHSLAEDGDLTYRAAGSRAGVEGVPVRPVRTVPETRARHRRPGLMCVRRSYGPDVPDPDQKRFFYGKAFIYPLFAAPFVRLFGTNGFLVLHAILLALVALVRLPVPPRAR